MEDKCENLLLGAYNKVLVQGRTQSNDYYKIFVCWSYPSVRSLLRLSISLFVCALVHADLKNGLTDFNEVFTFVFLLKC